MGLYDVIAGIDSKLAEAESLYNRGLYEEALEKIALDNVNTFLMSKANYVKTLFLYARCWYQMGNYDAAIRMLKLIIDDPEANNQYMSSAEALLQRIKREKAGES